MPAARSLGLGLIGLLAVLAGSGTPPPARQEPAFAACASCDARHQTHLRRLAARQAETLP